MTKEQTKCEYCHNKFEDMVDLSEFDGSLTMEKYNGQLRLSGYSFSEMGTNSEVFYTKPINYCPMCGRRLSDD